MRIRTSTRAKKPSRLAHLKKLWRAADSTRRRAIVIAVACVAGAAMLLTVREPSPEAATAQRRSDIAIGSKAKSAGTAAKSEDMLPVIPDAAATSGVAQDKQAPVTITGCLERDDKTFRLKDTDGDAAPKSRSWKSGFLKKGNASIAVIDASNRARLNDHVGKRVSVTGTLVRHEMQVRSVRRVAASCS